jgi:hypothetical protein
MNLKTWELSFRKELDVTEQRNRNFIRAVALQALRDLILGTRVRDGRARANWQVTVGLPAEGYLEIFDESGQATLQKGTATILQTDLFRDMPDNQSNIIWIHNGVPYIPYLEKLDKMLSGAVEAARTRIKSRLR